MKISIRNVANIKEATIEFDTNKLNFMYGISGSGKTTIGKLMSDKIPDLLKFRTFGSNNVPSYDSSVKTSFKIFDEDAIEEFIIAKSGVGIYEILYGENDDIRKLKKEFDSFLDSNDIVDIKSLVEKYNDDLKLLENSLGISATPTGLLSSSRGVMKELSKPKLYVDSKPAVDISVKSWIKSGHSFIEKNKCPFCSQDLTEDILNNLLDIINELPASFDELAKAAKSLKLNDITIDINNITDPLIQEKLKIDLQSKYKLRKELQNFREELNITIDDDSGLQRKSTLTLTKAAKDYFEKNHIDIQIVLEILNEKSSGFLLRKGIYNSKLRTTIKSNIVSINRIISSFGINYVFDKPNILNRTQNYNLRHTEADFDTSEFLSTGEKNVISLILFLFSNMDENLIIDDPASSFDEYRRDTILRHIFDVRYFGNASNKTTIILSHDQIFLKFLQKLRNNPRYNAYIGKVTHFENIQEVAEARQIQDGDIDYLSNHIIHRLSGITNNYLKILNLRLYYELVNKSSIEYSYLSAILHSKKNNLSVEELNQQIANKDTTEEEIIDLIEKRTNIKLTPFNQKIEGTLNEITLFESLCLLRESLTGLEKIEMDNIVHFNYSMQHVLNPYKFNFQSIKSYEILNRVGIV